MPATVHLTVLLGTLELALFSVVAQPHERRSGWSFLEHGPEATARMSWYLASPEMQKPAPGKSIGAAHRGSMSKKYRSLPSGNSVFS